MTSRPELVRDLGPLSIALALLAIGALAAALTRATLSWDLALFAPIGVSVVVLGFTTGAVGPRVDWSFGIALCYGGLAMSAPDQAPLIAVVLAGMMAYSEADRRDADLSRYVANLSQLILTGFTAGVVFEILRPPEGVPTSNLAAAVAATALVASLANLALVATVASYGYGTGSLAGVLRAAPSLVWRTVLLAVSVGVVASTVNLLGPAWIVIVMVLTVTLAALPLLKMRTESQRAELLATVTAALNARGVVSDGGGRLERLAVDAAQRLNFSAKQIEQLRYVLLLYLATDNYTGSLPRSIDDQLRDETGASTPSSALLFGLPLHDVADAAVIRLADAAAEFDAMCHPPDGGPGVARDDALRELKRSGTRPEIVAALASEEHISDSYLRAWRLHPEFVWRVPHRRRARRA